MHVHVGDKEVYARTFMTEFDEYQEVAVSRPTFTTAFLGQMSTSPSVVEHLQTCPSLVESS